MKISIRVSDKDHSYSYSTEDIELSRALLFCARVIIGFELEGDRPDADIMSDVERATGAIAGMLIMDD